MKQRNKTAKMRGGLLITATAAEGSVVIARTLIYLRAEYESELQ